MVQVYVTLKVYYTINPIKLSNENQNGNVLSLEKDNRGSPRERKICVGDTT